MKICLDSDFLVALLREYPDAIQKAEDLEKESHSLATTAMNALELYVGIMGVDGVSSARVERTEELIESLEILPLGQQAARRSAGIMNSLEKLGQPIGVKDTIVAGIALENRVPVMTRNIDHFERVTGLTILTW
ncbi:MAG: PIN domain-containing protein [Candidatus Hodarchaeales archaeon]|jgi:predicted nucleic acid-binding protein